MNYWLLDYDLNFFDDCSLNNFFYRFLNDLVNILDNLNWLLHDLIDIFNSFYRLLDNFFNLNNFLFLRNFNDLFDIPIDNFLYLDWLVNILDDFNRDLN